MEGLYKSLLAFKILTVRFSNKMDYFITLFSLKIKYSCSCIKRIHKTLTVKSFIKELLFSFLFKS